MRAGTLIYSNNLSASAKKENIIVKKIDIAKIKKIKTGIPKRRISGEKKININPPMNQLKALKKRPIVYFIKFIYSNYIPSIRICKWTAF